MLFRSVARVVAIALISSGVSVAQNQTQTLEFTLTVRNISSPETFYAVNPSMLGQGAYVLHTFRDPIFSAGRMARNNGLEALAEDGIAMELAEHLQGQIGVQMTGVLPISPLRPGEFTRVTFRAFPGQRLSLAIMLMESNDKFYAFDGEGVMLFTTTGLPNKGDITSLLRLWDAGTEVDEEPGFGLRQPLRQRIVNQGTEQRAPVRMVKEAPEVDRDNFRYPILTEQIQVILE